MSTPNATPTKTAIIFAGETITVTLRDQRSVTVRVRAMPARQLGRVLQLCTDEAALLELVCLIPAVEGDTPLPGMAGWQPVPENWADNLTDEAHLALLEAAKRLNFTRAAAWGERQIEAKQFQAPLLLKADEALSPIVEKLAKLLVSASSPSASPGAPSTKS